MAFSDALMLQIVAETNTAPGGVVGQAELQNALHHLLRSGHGVGFMDRGQVPGPFILYEEPLP